MNAQGPRGDYHDLPEWQLANATKQLILKTTEEKTWTEQWEWLRISIVREATRLTSTLEESYSSEHVAEWILGLGSCRNAIVMSDYIFTFMEGQGMLAPEKANPILASLKQLMTAIMTLSQKLRQDLLEHRRAASN